MAYASSPPAYGNNPAGEHASPESNPWQFDEQKAKVSR